MKPIKIIIIAVLFVFMVLACLQILGIINSEAATENASKAMYVVLIVGGLAGIRRSLQIPARISPDTLKFSGLISDLHSSK